MNTDTDTTTWQDQQNIEHDMNADTNMDVEYDKLSKRHTYDVYDGAATCGDYYSGGNEVGFDKEGCRKGLGLDFGVYMWWKCDNESKEIMGRKGILKTLII